MVCLLIAFSHRRMVGLSQGLSRGAANVVARFSLGRYSHVTLELEGLDRINLSVYLPKLQYPSGVATFLR